METKDQARIPAVRHRMAFCDREYRNDVPLPGLIIMQTKKGFVVAAGRSGWNWFFRSFHDRYEDAEHAMRKMIDVDAMRVVPATVTFGNSGNVRIWHSMD